MQEYYKVKLSKGVDITDINPNTSLTVVLSILNEKYTTKLLNICPWAYIREGLPYFQTNVYTWEYTFGRCRGWGRGGGGWGFCSFTVDKLHVFSKLALRFGLITFLCAFITVQFNKIPKTIHRKIKG